MFEGLFTKLDPVLYIQIWEERIKVTDIRTGELFDEAPLLAIEINKDGLKVVSAVGDDAKLINERDSIELISPFSHPRCLLNDFHVAERILQHIFGQILGKRFIAPTPKVVVHPMEKNEGGLTVIEQKAFREMALGAGAREVLIYQGVELIPSPATFDFEQLKKESEAKLSYPFESKTKKESPMAWFLLAVTLCSALFFVLHH